MFRSTLQAFSIQLVLAALLGVLSPPAVGGEAWSLLGLDSDDPLSRADRLDISEDLIRRLDILRRRVPMQKPDEAEEVRQQLTSLDDMTLASERRGRFFLSLPYQHYQLLELLDGARQELECIRTMEIPEVEHACWARLATIYLSEERLELGVGTLRAARLLPKDDDMPRPAQDPRVWYGEFGRGVVRRVLTPWIQMQGEAAQAAAGKSAAPVFPAPLSMDQAKTGTVAEPSTEDLSTENNEAKGGSP
ncbi:MAG: hypothetical protein FJ194_16365 [Gammaproteobacteria bacterium]|nr:hypothetical protein [Gammaproteobacteria bacterium]